VVTGNITGLPVRVIRNRMAEQFLNLESTGRSPLMAKIFGAGKMKQAFVDGDADEGSVMAGQICGLIHDQPTCEELLQRTMREFRETCKVLERQV
jgi:enoyl-[acyl-carrier protein] reductase II